MAAPVVIFRGKAAVEGVPGAFDAVVYAIVQSFDATQEYDKEEVKDPHGYDIAWLARNENAKFNCKMKLVGDTAAHAATLFTAVGSTAMLSAMGQGFLAPLSTLTLSGFTLAAFNAVFQLQPGSKLTQVNDKVAEFDLNLMRYANTDQQTGIATIPA